MSADQWVHVLTYLLLLEIFAVGLAATWAVRSGRLTWYAVYCILWAAALHPVQLLKIICKRKP